MDMPLENFKAATKFLYNFKKKHLIVSRKITKIISRELSQKKSNFKTQLIVLLSMFAIEVKKSNSTITEYGSKVDSKKKYTLEGHWQYKVRSMFNP
jgi:hypothetical protein